MLARNSITVKAGPAQFCVTRCAQTLTQSRTSPVARVLGVLQQIEDSAMKWTHITLPVSDVDGSIKFFTKICGLSVVRDRRREGGSTIWLGPRPKEGVDPDFVLVITKGTVEKPLDHFGFQCDSLSELEDIARNAEEDGALVTELTFAGGSVGHFCLVREPSGHLVELTYGQPLRGLGAVSA